MRLERERAHGPLEVLGETPELLVVGLHDGDRVAGRGHRQETGEVRLDGADRDQHVGGGRARVPPGDRLAQLEVAVGLGVVKLGGGDRRQVRAEVAALHRQQSAHGQGVHAAL